MEDLLKRRIQHVTVSFIENICEIIDAADIGEHYVNHSRKSFERMLSKLVKRVLSAQFL